MIKLLGILGGLCFSYCGIPAALATIKKGQSIGIPVSTAWMITLGGIFMYAYLYLSYGFDWILTINYAIEVVSWAIIVFYHYKSLICKLFGHSFNWKIYRGEPLKHQGDLCGRCGFHKE